MAIGEYELAVLKAIHFAGGTIDLHNPMLEVASRVQGDICDAVGKLHKDEYVQPDSGAYRLTDLAVEYLELLGLN